MDIGAVEVEIVEFLRSKLNDPEYGINDPNTFVEPLPEAEIEFEKAWGKRKIFVGFNEEMASPNIKSIDMSYQESNYTFSFLIQSNLLRGDKGIYQLAEFIKAFMLGFKPVNSEKFIYSGFRFVQKVKNVFEYSLDFSTKGIVTQTQFSSEQIGGNFNDIKLS
ncbi:MAG: hypothetical protein J7577_13310 [Sphingobacteriaceae bacterium]|nr:hypothetical protein [Sphingobacteriaceae bacterium]